MEIDKSKWAPIAIDSFTGHVDMILSKFTVATGQIFVGQNSPEFCDTVYP